MTALQEFLVPLVNAESLLLSGTDPNVIKGSDDEEFPFLHMRQLLQADSPVRHSFYTQDGRT